MEICVCVSSSSCLVIKTCGYITACFSLHAQPHTWAMWSNNCTILISSQENRMEYTVRAFNEEMRHYLIATLDCDASIFVRFTSLSWFGSLRNVLLRALVLDPIWQRLIVRKLRALGAFRDVLVALKTLTVHNQDEVVLWLVFLWLERLSQIVKLAKARFNLIAAS